MIWMMMMCGAITPQMMARSSLRLHIFCNVVIAVVMVVEIALMITKMYRNPSAVGY